MGWSGYTGWLRRGRRRLKTGTGTPASIAAVGVNSVAGAVIHVVMIVVFFALARHDLTQAFKLPSGGKILLILAGSRYGHRDGPECQQDG